MSRSEEREIVADFQEAYATSAPLSLWLGEPVSTLPLDLWMYQEILHEVRPDVIVAVNTLDAGYLADICEMGGTGDVLAVSDDPAYADSPPARDRIRVVKGSSVATEIFALVKERTGGDEAVLVVLGNRSADGVDDLDRQLALYGSLVTPGSFLIVEDTQPGPDGDGGLGGSVRAKAVARFAQQHPEFVVDATKERLYLTQNPGGYLRRVR